MRKVLLIVAAFLLLSFNGYSQKWHGITAENPVKPKKVLVSSTEKQTVVDFYLSGYYSTTVNTPEGEKIVVTVDDMYPMLEAGAPDVPLAYIPVLIGDRAEMSVRVSNSEYVDIEDVEVAPSKGNFSRQINPEDVPYTYGEMYQQDAFFPSSQVSLESPYILRDFRGQNIMIYPFAYNAVTKTLRVYTRLEIVMEKVSDNGVNAKTARKGNVISMDPEIKSAYSRRFINFEEATAAKYEFLDDAGEMLVVCADSYMEAMQPYVNWKNISGRPTTIVPTSEAGTTGEAVKEYVSAIYETNPNLTFVLLVGEYNDIRPHSMSGGCSDNYIGMLEGNDYYLEVFVGRFSVRNVQDVETHVNKVLYYERDMKDVTWVTTGLGVAANEGSGLGHQGGEADYVHMNYIRDTLLHYTYSDVKCQYSGVGSGTSSSAISADVNAGTSIINYCNHGSATSWAVGSYSVTHVNALTNDNMWPVIWSVACNNGQFDYDECFGEAWMRATNSETGNPTGAIGGMFSWISQPWTPPMTGQDEMVDIMCGWINDSHKHTLAGTSLNGNMKILDAHPSDNGSTHNTWILFGDPSLMMRNDNPTSMNVSCNPSVLMLGMSNMQVTADAEFGIATLSREGEVIASANVVNGVADLSFEPLNQVGSYDFVVIGYNKETYVGNIEVVPAEGPYLVFDSYDFEDENGQFDYGENVELSMSVKNVGVETANNLTVTLSTDSEYIDMVNNTLEVSSVAANEVKEIEGQFTFNVAVDVPDGQDVTFVLSITDGNDVWESSFKAQLHAPVFEMVGVTLDNNSIQPGSNGVMNYSFVNSGSSSAYNVSFEVFSSSNDVVLTTNNVSFDVVAAGETVVAEIPFTVSDGVELGSTYEMVFGVNAGHYLMEGNYVLSVGAIMEDFETGDFSKYDWQLSGNQPWIISTDAVNGTYSAQSGEINDSQSSSMQVELNVLMTGEMTFYYKVSSESNYDKLTFYIDGNKMDDFSGSIEWTQASYTVTAGEHVFEWRYSKDSSVSSGSDCAWIDDIEFPPTNVVLAIEPVSNLVADVMGNTVNLSWSASPQAAEYAVYRNGEELTVQAGTSLSDDVDNGVYTYSVVARSADGANSRPVYATVNVGTVDVAEVGELMVSIYPNPSNGIVNIAGSDNMEVSVFNCQGQIVVNQVMSDKLTQIDLSGLTKGIYFLRLTNSDGVVVKKVVLE